MRDYSKITKPTPERYCAYCGAKMERARINGRLEDLAVFKRRKYCNRECMKRAFVKTEGSEQNYSSSHHSARKIAYLIGDRPRVCELCGSTKNIDVHHKDEDYNNNSPENLMIVCRSCHMKIHRPKPMCVICGKPIRGHNYCNMHYIRWKKYGDPLIFYGKKVDVNFSERKSSPHYRQLSLF